MSKPYSQRRQILDGRELAGPHWCTARAFDDRDALWSVVERDELEGIVAKPFEQHLQTGRTALVAEK